MAKRTGQGTYSYTPTRGVLRGRVFASEYAYRTALAKKGGHKTVRARRRRAKPITSVFQAQRLTPKEGYARERALEALSRMRRDGRLSLATAAQRSGTAVDTVLRYAGTAFRRDGSGRFVAKPRDGLLRRLRFLTSKGQIALDVTNSETATTIANHAAAVREFLRTGRTDQLRQFRGKMIRVGKIRYSLLTDPLTLRQLAEADQITYEFLYA
jgi:hypothetical protein